MSDTAEEFLSFEVEQSLFDFYIDDIPIWERIRFPIYRRITEEDGVGQAHTKTEESFETTLRRINLLLKNAFFKNPYFEKNTRFLFKGHSRRKKESDGFWWDLYCDPIHENCDLDYIHLETPHLLEHHQPAKTANLKYLELVSYLGAIKRKLGLVDFELSESDCQRLLDLENKINSTFNSDIEVREIAQWQLLKRASTLELYQRLLRRINPSVVVLVVSYDDETFIEACQNEEIPVIELQHGVIHKYHFGYSYPGKRDKVHFPDYLFLWGDFWADEIEFPLSDKRIISVGYPYIEQRRVEYENIQQKDQILFISQGTIGEQLSKFALDVESHPDIDQNVVYKLHPGEYDRWQKEYPWLVEADFAVIDSSEPPLYQLFAESSIQVGVGSTAVYEGLCLDLETFVYECPGSSVLDPLIENGSATLVSSVDELVASLGTVRSSFKTDYYFASNATQSTCEVLKRLANQGTPYREDRSMHSSPNN